MIYQDILDDRALQSYLADLNARARKCGANGELDVAGLRDRILASSGRCEWCGENLVRGTFELDHVVSLNRGGRNETDNLVVACPDCNRRKGQKHPARFAAEIFNSTGRRTILVDKILQHFMLEPREQLPLFAANQRTEDLSDTCDRNDQPRYRW